MSKNAKRARRKRRGQYCWCCRSTLSNERFSGKGHGWHLCKECQRLPIAEQEFRSAKNNLNRCMTWQGIIPRKQRPQFEAFLEHPDARIRGIAIHMQREDARIRSHLCGEYEPWEDGRSTGDANLDFGIAAAGLFEEASESESDFF